MDALFKTTNVFFDCEMSKLVEAFDTEPAELISTGCISDSAKRFYAENSNSLCRPELMSCWVKENVIQLLDGGECLMEYAEITA